MAGLTDYTAQALLNWQTGQLAMPALASRYLGLFTTAPTSDSGVTGAVEVSGGAYARVQVAGSAVTNGATASGNATLNFAATPAWIVAGMSVTDLTAPAVISAATTVLSKTGTTVVMSANAAGAGVGSGDTIVFSAFTPAVASSGAEPVTAPASVSNASAIITFAQATADWGTSVAAGMFDALTSGNLTGWDYMGNNKWLPFSGSSATPGVLTSPAHGYANGNSVVVTAKDGGTLPATAGSWAGLLTVANVTTDTFTAGVNTTGTGDGLVRKVASQPMPINVTMSVPAGSMILTVA